MQLTVLLPFLLPLAYGKSAYSATTHVFDRAFTGLQRQSEFQRYDGYYNNLANNLWGSVGVYVRLNVLIAISQVRVCIERRLHVMQTVCT